MRKVVHTMKSVSRRSHDAFATKIATEWLESKGYKVKSFPDNFLCNVVGIKGDEKVGYLVTASEDDFIFPRWRKLAQGVSEKEKIPVLKQIKSELEARLKSLGLTTFENLFVQIHPARSYLYKSSTSKAFDCKEGTPEIKVYRPAESEIIVVKSEHKSSDDVLDDAVLRLISDCKVISGGFSDLQKS